MNTSMGTTWDYKTKPQTVGDTFSSTWAPGPWLRTCAYFCPGAGAAQSVSGIVPGAGKEHGTLCTGLSVCTECSCPGTQEGS